MKRALLASCAGSLSVLGAARADAQLSLGEAFRQADRSAYVNRIAAGGTAAHAA